MENERRTAHSVAEEIRSLLDELSRPELTPVESRRILSRIHYLQQIFYRMERDEEQDRRL